MAEPANQSASLMPRGMILSLWLIVATNIAVSSTVWAIATGWSWRTGLNPWFSWLSLLLAGIVSGQVIHFALAMLLMEFRRSIKWITTLLILIASAAAMTTGHFFGLRIGLGREIPLITVTAAGQFGVYSAFVLTVGVFVVLGLQVLIWPVAASLGWQLRRVDRIPVYANAKFSLFQLFGWVGLIAALLSLIRTLAGLDDWWFALLIFSLPWLLPALVGAIPTLLFAARVMQRPWWLGLLIPYALIISFAESELTVIPFRLRVTGTWWPTWILMVFNGGIVFTVLLNAFVLRACGLILDLPLWPRRVEVSNRRANALVAETRS